MDPDRLPGQTRFAFLGPPDHGGRFRWFFGFYVLFSSYVISQFSRYQRGEWCRVRFPFWLFCSHVQPSPWRLPIRTVPLGWAVSPFFALSLLVAGNSWELRGKRAIEGINTKRRGTLFQQRWGWWLNPEDGGVGCADGCLPCYPSAVRFNPRARQATNWTVLRRARPCSGAARKETKNRPLGWKRLQLNS